MRDGKRTAGPASTTMKVAYVFTDVPSHAGTFANAELQEMASRRLPIEVFILRNRLPPTDGAREVVNQFIVHRTPYLFSIALFRDVCRAMWRQPGVLIRTILEIVRDNAVSPVILARALAILPKSIHFAFVAQERGMTLIHAYWASMPALSAHIISRFSGIPFSTWAHAGADIYNRRRQTPRSLRSRLRDARLVLTCNSANLPHFRTLSGVDVLQKVVLLTHGVDIAKFPLREIRRSANTLRVLAVGRLSAAKGIDVLLNACRLLMDHGIAIECSIAGSGPLEPELRAMSARLGLDDAVSFLGYVEHSEMPALHQKADVFVVPSVIGPAGARDGLPNVLLEAMASGLPCVASDIASIPEVIRDDHSGLLVPPADPVALATALERLVTDEGLRVRLGRNGAALVRADYARKPVMDRLYAIFLELHSKQNIDAA